MSQHCKATSDTQTYASSSSKLQPAEHVQRTCTNRGSVQPETPVQHLTSTSPKMLGYDKHAGRNQPFLPVLNELLRISARLAPEKAAEGSWHAGPAMDVTWKHHNRGKPQDSNECAGGAAPFLASQTLLGTLLGKVRRMGSLLEPPRPRARLHSHAKRLRRLSRMTFSPFQKKGRCNRCSEHGRLLPLLKTRRKL